MTGTVFLQFGLFVLLTMALAIPCAFYLVRVFTREPMGADILLGPLEHLAAFFAGPEMLREQSWVAYTISLLIFNALGAVLLFAILICQAWLPWNPQQFGNVPFLLAFNIAISFVTNTDWQAYGGESTLSYFSQMAGLTVQNYLSAATGIAVAFAVIRGFIRKETSTLGNFYSDVIRVTLYVLLPMSIIFALFLIWQGVPQNMLPYVQATTLEGGQQLIAQGPAAGQIAIKMLGSNGGGFFNANAAHPYENPTPLANLVQIASILLLPIALVLAFGRLVGDKRQGWALFASMSVLFVVMLAACYHFESAPHPILAGLNVDQAASEINPGGNMEGKETRFGIFQSVLWSDAATATSNGSANSMLDSYMPMAGLVPLFNMLIGEVIYGGAGCGLYGILIYVLITVFIAGLMVGRTPEYLGKKIEADEMKLSVLAMFIYPVCVLCFGVAALLTPEGAKSLSAAGPHGLTQMIYTYASAAANNGTAFAGFNANTDFHNIMTAIVMLIGRYGVIIPVLAIAGSLAHKKILPVSSGTFPTHGGMFVVLLTGVIVMFGGLTYFPALALGPLAEHFPLFTR